LSKYKDVDIATQGYTLTYHKSQGKEWSEVYLYPIEHSDDTTKNVIYTGISRAKETIHMPSTDPEKKLNVSEQQYKSLYE
jgi:hypothetical protein